MANVKALNDTVKEIEDHKFRWHQGDWVQTRYIDGDEKIAFEDLPNECGTAYCFAGRVASHRRELLFDSLGKGFMASTYFVALDTDNYKVEAHLPGDTAHDMYRAIRGEDGTTEFVKFRGRIISARNAAISDLGIAEDDADDLFSASNKLDDIKKIIERIIYSD